jgi:YfiH family protein
VPPYDSLNLGTHVGDDAAAVARNRAKLQQTLGARPVFMDQVHGSRMLELASGTPDGLAADGAYTRVRALACTVMVADCLPILLCDRQGLQVAAVHAGWRGLAGQQGVGVLETICKTWGAPADELLAWLGPCIGPTAFEVGDEVLTAFTATLPQAQNCFRTLPAGKWLADLPGLARQRLRRMGVTQVFGNDGSAPWCTAGNPLRFFSHRRDRVSGRQAACIWLD